MIEQEVIQKVIVFRRGVVNEGIQPLLREVADYLDNNPNDEEMFEELQVDFHLSEPTIESAPDCDVEYEARLYIAVPKDKIPMPKSGLQLVT